MSYNFALTGISGYIAPRHLRAIKDTGNQLVAALDPHDSVGIIDSFFPDAKYFNEFERFDRHLEKLRRIGENARVHYVSICAPNYLHDAHIRLALRTGAHAICEKPLVLNPWNLDALSELEREYGRKVFTILQLRVHPVIVALKNRIAEEINNTRHEIDLTYVTPRGEWYHRSWKGDVSKSGGLATNIGVHFFDMLIWIFGGVRGFELHKSSDKRIAGELDLEHAHVRWFLSIDRNDLPPQCTIANKGTFRSVLVDGEEIDFTEGFGDLHTEVYRRTLAGHGFGIDDTRASISLVHDIRAACHPHAIPQD